MLARLCGVAAVVFLLFAFVSTSELKVFGCATDNLVQLKIILTSRICVTLHVSYSVSCFTLT